MLYCSSPPYARALRMFGTGIYVALHDGVFNDRCTGDFFFAGPSAPRSPEQDGVPTQGGFGFGSSGICIAR